MDFYFPDSQDQIDPRFDFADEEHPPFHVRQRDDLYAHEALDRPGFDGILVSKGIVDGVGGKAGRYTVAQRHRLYRLGVHKFFRLPEGMKTLGDCGAFSYVDEEEPPITPADALEFYEVCGFDAGISVDHVILGFGPHSEATPEWRARQDLTLEYAAEFLELHGASQCRFTPLGVAQGWSPESYAHSVERLQQMGYRRIAMGGMVPLKTAQILAVLAEVGTVRLPQTRLHLLGVTRTEQLHEFRSHGVASFDSTAPFRQAFMDDRDNYHWRERAYTAIRVPPVDGNAQVKRSVKSGELDQGEALRLEKECLRRLRRFDGGSEDVDRVLDALGAYHRLLGHRDRSDEYRQTLEDRPWKQCRCGICAKDGIEVAIFRGTERNKRRGFHNVAVFGSELARRLADGGGRDGAEHGA